MFSLRNLVMLVVVTTALPVSAQTKPVPKDKAIAALNLAGAARERMRSLPLVANSYYDALKEAEQAKKPLIVWVGIAAIEKPQLYESLCKDAHCVRLPDYFGSKEPRVIYQGADGLMYSFSSLELDKPAAIKQIKSGWVHVKQSEFSGRTDGIMVRE